MTLNQLPTQVDDSPGVPDPAGYKGIAGFHKYWGKKPTEAWRFLIERLTEPTDLVVDPFLGSGLIAREAFDLGRRFVGIDVNPISIELTKLYLLPPDPNDLSEAFRVLDRNVRPVITESYRLQDGSNASHYLWDSGELTRIWRRSGTSRVREEVAVTRSDVDLARQYQSYEPIHPRRMHLFDNARINAKKDFDIRTLFTGRALRNIDLLIEGIASESGSLKRGLQLTLTASMGQMSKMVFAVTGRGKTSGNASDQIQVGSWVIGYWRPDMHFEINSWNCFNNKGSRLIKGLRSIYGGAVPRITDDLHAAVRGSYDVGLVEEDAERALSRLPDGSAKVVLTDPPHSDRIPYLELSEMWNSVLGVEVSFEDELVVSNANGRNKDTASYEAKFARVFGHAARVLCDGGVLALMFNARSPDHWESIRSLERQTGLTFLGQYPLKYSAGSVVQDNRTGGLKGDYVLVYGKGRGASALVEDRLSDLSSWSRDFPKD